jgi:hypothetical protein
MTKVTFGKISPLLFFLIFLAGSLSIVFAQAPGTAEESDGGVEGGVAIIDFDHREYDFGRQLAEQDLEHTFTVYNKGTVPLTITSIRTG